MPPWVVYVWYFSVVCLAESTAGEDVRGGEAGRFGDAVEKEDLVRWGYKEDTRNVSKCLRP